MKTRIKQCNIDGWKAPPYCNYFTDGDVSYYIITLENAIECVLESSVQGLYVMMEPDADSKTIFWNKDGSETGTIDELTIYNGDKKKTIDLTTFWWHRDFLAWHKFFQDNIHSGYKNINNVCWLKWWLKGWELAKEIRKLLPEDVEFMYGHRSQAVQVLNDEDMNSEPFCISFPKTMQHRIDEELFVQNAYVDMEYNDDENCNYLFKLNGLELDFHPDDRVMLGVNGRPHYQTGTVIRCIDDGLLIHTDWPLDISESYSIEIIV